MSRKISNAPAPIGSLPVGSAALQAEPKPKPRQTKTPSNDALLAHMRFQRAIRNRHRTDAEFYAQQCRDQGLSEAKLREVSHLLDALGEYRTDAGTNQALETPVPKQKEANKRGIIRDRMMEDCRQEKISLSQLRYMSGKDLKENYGSYTNRWGKVGYYDRGTISKARKEAMRILSSNNNRQ
jgi:hypothetical protein